jgi:3-oxoacyl-[acyl-carrier-protein] synthase-1
MEARERSVLSVAVADNIVSPLGFTTADNYAAVKKGITALRRYEGLWNIPTPFAASMVHRDAVLKACAEAGIIGQYTFFEKMVLLSITHALQQWPVDTTSERTLFILSTTKGNIELLSGQDSGVGRLELGTTAKVIAEYFHNHQQPVVVSNACISGLCAQIEAFRLIRTGCYDTVVVCGADVLSPFIVSGFQSLMALSDEPCRPFDEDRQGINLGDAAATIIYKGIKASEPTDGKWQVVSGAIRNDAFHISAPSRSAEGCVRALRSVLHEIDTNDIAFLNAHGTATLFNDEMESVAIDRAGLSAVPVNSLKGYFGHTMGAAGIVESIISMHAASEGVILGTKGFENLGVSKYINVSSDNRPTDKHTFIKMMSGFGGCNAAIAFRKLRVKR